MIKSKNNFYSTILIILCVIFIATEGVLGYFIQEPINPPVNGMQFSAIVLACVFFILFAERSSAYIFTQLALIFTVGADYFLVIAKQPNQINGIICFSFVQAAYFLRLYLDEKNPKKKKIHLITRIAIPVVAVGTTFLFLGEKTDALSVISVFYYSNLALNLIFSFASFKTHYLMAFGFLCFLLCDTVIGLVNMGPYLSLPEGSFINKLLYPGFDPAWAFYIPSQILLALSLLPDKLRKLKKRA